MSGARRIRIPAGDAGIARTVQYMRELVHDSMADPLLIGTAEAIGAQYCCPNEQAQGIREFLAATVRFTPDPSGLELLKTPAYMLSKVELTGFTTGDCDDVAILGAALGMALAMPARFVLVGFDPGQPLQHVWTELGTPDGWAELDVTRPSQDLAGIRVVRRQTVEV
jgi:hypothetical protein